MIIVPAILEQDPVEFKKKFDLVPSFASVVQIDIADGVFVPNRTVQIAEIAPHFAKASRGKQIPIEWHLMVTDPLASIINISKGTVIFHDESTEKPKEIIASARSRGLKVGVAINPSTPPEVIDQYSEKIDMVTVMTVEPGFQGSPFVPSCLSKIADLKARFPNLIIEIDGGVNESNLEGVAATGVDQIVVGSGIWKSPDPAQKYQQLKDRLKLVS